MKMKVTLAVVGLSVLGAAANAQLTFTLDAPTIVGGVSSYGGSIVNNTTTSYTINGVNVDFPGIGDGTGVLSYTENFADFTFGDVPLTLAPGDFYNTNSFFELTVPANFPDTTYTYGLAGGTSGANLASAPVRVGVTAVPEPGAVALLASGLVGSGLFVARRRRK